MKTQFHLPEGHYFLSHSVGCLPVDAQHAFTQSVLEPWSQNGGDAWPQWLSILNDFHNAIGAVINAPANGVCAQVNLSSGLTKFLTGLPTTFGKGNTQKRVLMHSTAFPSLGFVVSALASLGFELILIDEDDCPCELDTWQQWLSKDIDICLVTHVHSNTGKLSPVKEILQICQAKNVLSIVDVAQSIGVVPINTAKWNADVVLGSCVKWLCGGPGAGFIWVKDEWLSRLTPIDVGWFSHENPFEFDIRHFQYAQNNMKMLGGTPSIAPYALALIGISTITNLGIDHVVAHNKQLKAYFFEQVASKLLTSPQLTQQGGTLCLTFSDSDKGNAHKLNLLCTYLNDNNVYYDQRGNTLRISFHVYNDASDVDVLVEGIVETDLNFSV